jgi:hypothetical protein
MWPSAAEQFEAVAGKVDGTLTVAASDTRLCNALGWRLPDGHCQ